MASVRLKAPETGYRYGTQQDVTILDCAECSMTFGITAAFEKRRRGDQRTFYCPNGHGNHYGGETEAERLKRLLESERSRAGRLASERDQARAAERGQRSAKTRFKNERDRDRQRIAAGVCPCCNRSFQNLARHMACQHPEFASAGEGNGDA